MFVHEFGVIRRGWESQFRFFSRRNHRITFNACGAAHFRASSPGRYRTAMLVSIASISPLRFPKTPPSNSVMDFGPSLKGISPKTT